MASAPTYRPVYKQLIEPLTILGIERRLFFCAILLGAVVFNLFYTFVGGLIVAVGGLVLARGATLRDPEMLHILFMSSRFRARYDPAKHEPFDVILE